MNVNIKDTERTDWVKVQGVTGGGSPVRRNLQQILSPLGRHVPMTIQSENKEREREGERKTETEGFIVSEWQVG